MSLPLTASKRFLKSFLVALLLLCVCIALIGLLGSGNELDLAPIRNNKFLVPALVLQVGASLLFILAWKTILDLQTTFKCSYAECGAHIGVTLLGKYLPGKIWGLLGRSYLLTRHGLPAGAALDLLLADQFVTFYTGIMLGLVALLAFYYPVMAVIFAVVVLFAFPVCLHFYNRIMRAATTLLGKLTHKVVENKPAVGTITSTRPFYTAFLVYTMHWLATALVLCLLFYPAIEHDSLAGIIIITAAIPLAMLLGFIAVWAPGGIGVREGTIVAILVLQFPLELALTIAIYYRLICIAIDLVLGAFSVFYLVRKAPWLLTQEQTG